MSLIVSFPYPDRVEILTDGAHYTSSGRFGYAREKIYRSPHAPLVISGRGNAAMVKQFAQVFLAAAECGSAYKAMVDIEMRFDRWRAAGNTFKGKNFQMFIAGFAPEWGANPAQMQVCSAPNQPYEGMEAMRVHTIHGVYYAGPPIEEADVAHVLTADRVRDGVAAVAPELCQILRQKTDHGIDDAKKRRFPIVGGHIDHTVLTPAGAITQRLLTWPERRFQQIDPTLQPILHERPSTSEARQPMAPFPHYRPADSAVAA